MLEIHFLPIKVVVLALFNHGNVKPMADEDLEGGWRSYSLTTKVEEYGLQVTSSTKVYWSIQAHEQY
ncbi:hypothetical protein Y032_0037g3468 [Ancylostoma ceylanicum]|uniref:Uncharacterized protein n=1 Tax=Ancylostoma ceylanicum TaxID=53326 RepID=A0A016UKA1_9BILA|nr:hypothetical protein Y032_0037g3468 [Ancylostoma ceylanicum]